MTLRGGKAFKESFQGGARFSRREEPGYRRQRASVRKKTGFPGGQTLQRELMGAENKRKTGFEKGNVPFLKFIPYYFIYLIGKWELLKILEQWWDTH